MKTIRELKKEKEQRIHKLFDDCKVFWAFSDEQFAENKVALDEGDKYVSIGGGGYMPKSLVDTLTEGMKQINKDFKQAVKDNKQREANVLYELRNHEAFYTGDIEPVVDALGADYSVKEIKAVYNKHREAELSN